jgi:hypothetical protein
VGDARGRGQLLRTAPVHAVAAAPENRRNPRKPTRIPGIPRPAPRDARRPPRHAGNRGNHQKTTRNHRFQPPARDTGSQRPGCGALVVEGGSGRLPTRESQAEHTPSQWLKSSSKSRSKIVLCSFSRVPRSTARSAEATPSWDQQSSAQERRPRKVEISCTRELAMEIATARLQVDCNTTGPRDQQVAAQPDPKSPHERTQPDENLAAHRRNEGTSRVKNTAAASTDTAHKHTQHSQPQARA